MAATTTANLVACKQIVFSSMETKDVADVEIPSCRKSAHAQLLEKVRESSKFCRVVICRLSGYALKRRRWAVPVAPEVWPAVGPFRLVISREEVAEDGRILYYNEQLQCGHVHQALLDGSRPAKRRRSRQCRAL